MAKTKAQPRRRRHTPGVATPPPPLPRFVAPMLATPGEAFDSDDYLFEVKWDGTRALAFAERGTCRLVNRRGLDITQRYPELVKPLAGLPDGTLLDGEVVVLGTDGKPDFSALQSREQASTPTKAARLGKLHPATYVVFDQLYRTGEAILKLRCGERREVAGRTVRKLADPRVIFSAGILGSGKAYFEQACLACIEGVIAKRLDSPYLPGRRSDAWVKIKRHQTVHCVVIGFEPEGADDFAALIVATEHAGDIRCVGKVGTGFDRRRRAKINAFLWSHLRRTPLVPPGKYRGRWVEFGLYCAVRCMERTAGGQLRAPAVVEVYGA